MKVIIYSNPNHCPYCVRAKQYLDSKGIISETKIVGVDITKEALFEACGGPVRTVPQIFLMEDGFAEYIGGYQELVNHPRFK